MTDPGSPDDMMQRIAALEAERDDAHNNLAISQHERQVVVDLCNELTKERDEARAAEHVKAVMHKHEENLTAAHAAIVAARLAALKEAEGIARRVEDRNRHIFVTTERSDELISSRSGQFAAKEIADAIAAVASAPKTEPWRRCLYTDCQRAQECRSPNECVASASVPISEFAALRAENERLGQKSDDEMERVKACEHIADGDEGWEVLRELCPSTAAVARLRDALDEARAAEHVKAVMHKHEESLTAAHADIVAARLTALKEAEGIAQKEARASHPVSAEQDACTRIADAIAALASAPKMEGRE